ncbi:protease inhibitor I42 family protein [Enterobacteriaceae bacterium LUAb1]
MNKAINVALTATMMLSACSVVAGSNTTLQTDKGKETVLSLDSNPTTGYVWMIKKLPTELVFVSSDFTKDPACKAGASGCSGKQSFVFIGDKAGKGKLEMIHGRSFDQSTWQKREIDVTVK